MDVQCSAARCSTAQQSSTLAAGAAHHACRRQRRLRASSHPGAEVLYVCRPRPAQIWSPCGAARDKERPRREGTAGGHNARRRTHVRVRENGGRDADADRAKPRVCVRRETVKDGGAWSSWGCVSSCLSQSGRSARGRGWTRRGMAATGFAMANGGSRGSARGSLGCSSLELSRTRSQPACSTIGPVLTV